MRDPGLSGRRAEMPPVLLDTGVIVALLDRRERRHKDCVEMVNSLQHPLVTCEAVISESCHLLDHLPGFAEAVIENVAAAVFQIPFQLSASAGQIQAILRKYRDTPADFADACLVHMADELGTGDILTLDRHFRHYRWRRNRPFNLL